MAGEDDITKVLKRKRKQRKHDPEKKVLHSIKMVKQSEAHCIQRAVNRIEGHGIGTCDKPAIKQQMLKKFPASNEVWEEHVPEEDGSDMIEFKDLQILMNTTDPTKGVGPRQFYQHYVYCLSRAKTTDGQHSINEFERLGLLVVDNRVPWVSLLLAGAILCPLHKQSEGDDCRPAVPQDRDYATWWRAVAKDHVEGVRAETGPQQLAVGVSGGVEILGHGLNLTVEQARNNDQSLIFSSFDIENAHNNFSRASAMKDIRLATAKDDAKIKKSFARAVSKYLDLQPQVFYRTNEASIGLKELCRIESGGAQGNAMTAVIYPMTINAAAKEIERTFPDTMVRLISDNVTMIGSPANTFGPVGAIETVIRLLELRGNKVTDSQPIVSHLAPVQTIDN